MESLQKALLLPCRPRVAHHAAFGGELCAFTSWEIFTARYSFLGLHISHQCLLVRAMQACCPQQCHPLRAGIRHVLICLSLSLSLSLCACIFAFFFFFWLLGRLTVWRYSRSCTHACILTVLSISSAFYSSKRTNKPHHTYFYSTSITISIPNAVPHIP